MERLVFIRFNPWKKNYKQPFGAAQVNSLVRLSIEVIAQEIAAVTLVIHKDFEETTFIPMEKHEGDFYSYEYFLNQGPGLYYYHFEVELHIDGQRQKVLFGANQEGGEGQIQQLQSDVWDFQLTCYAQDDAAPQWYQEGIFYQIFPDRFYNANPSGLLNQRKKNSFVYGTLEDEPLYIKNEKGEILRWDFFGGNLKGIQAKIPYLKELGVTGLYLNPIFEAASNHRYDTADFLAIDPMLGTEADFIALVEALHRNDMRIILDGVFSHVGQNSRYFNVDGRYGDDQGAYRNIRSPYYSWFQFINYPETYRSWWGIADLPTIDKTNRSFQTFIYGGEDSVISKWTRLGVDGWRLDVADELPEEFIRGIRENLNQFSDKVLIGEVWEDASNKISYKERRNYILGNQLHGVMNYPLREGVIALLTSQASPEKIARSFTRLYENYPKDIFLNNFNNIGTHDTERIFSVLDEQIKKMDLAIGLLFLFPGVPCIYYGDEVGLTGGKDPENRKFYPWNREDRTIYDLYKKWITIRQTTPTVIDGELAFFYTDQLFGLLRCQQDQYVALVLNPTSIPCVVSETLTFLTEENKVTNEIGQRLANQTIAENSYFLLSSQS